MGVGDILRRSAFNNASKPALVFENRRMNYGELNQSVNRLANSLLQIGLQKGDRVAVLLHNSPEFFEVYFACAKSGAIFVPINNLFRKKELLQVFQYIEPRFLIYDDEFNGIVQAILPELKFLEFPIVLRGQSSGCKNYAKLIDEAEGREPTVVIADDDIANIFLTSGTTGRPKGAMRPIGTM